MSCITTLIRNNLKTSFYINFIAEAVAIIVFLTVVNSLSEYIQPFTIFH